MLANGEVLRTGMGALPGAKTWQQYKSGFGPWIDGIFSQSNFGVVTKMGFWLMPEPDSFLSGTVFVPRHDDLIPLVEIMTYLENTRVTTGMPELGSPLLGRVPLSERVHEMEWGKGDPWAPSAGSRDPELTGLLAKPGGDASAEVEQYALRKGVSFWSCTLCFYGAPKANAANWEFAKEKFSAIPGAKFEDGKSYKLPLTAEQRDEVHKPQFGIPSWRISRLERDRKLILRPGPGISGLRRSFPGRGRRFSKRIACLPRLRGN